MAYHRLSALRRLFIGFSVCLVVLGISSPANAGSISTTVLSITASTDSGSGVLTVPFDALYYDAEAGTYDWTLDAPVTLTDGQGNTLATIMGLNTYIECDPLLSVNFLIRAGSSDVQIDIASASLAFDALDPAEGITSAQLGGTDLNGNGFAITGMFDDGKCYRAYYNTDQVYASLLDSQAADMYGSSSLHESYPNSAMGPFPVPVTEMSLGLSFELSARDMVSGTSVYNVIPEPQTIALLLIGSLLSLRKR